jgi:hypothetical protein
MIEFRQRQIGSDRIGSATLEELAGGPSGHCYHCRWSSRLLVLQFVLRLLLTTTATTTVVILPMLLLLLLRWRRRRRRRRRWSSFREGSFAALAVADNTIQASPRLLLLLPLPLLLYWIVCATRDPLPSSSPARNGEGPALVVVVAAAAAAPQCCVGPPTRRLGSRNQPRSAAAAQRSVWKAREGRLRISLEARGAGAASCKPPAHSNTDGGES